ncbi:MAG: hypothetical protein V1712_01160 [Patescibacteria group bacterium]
MRRTPESMQNPEHEKNYSSKIELYYFRHDEKGKVGEGQTDFQVRLTEAGRKHALEYGKEVYKSKPEEIPSVAFGSLRERAQETAGFVMGGEGVTGDESLEELKLKLNKGREYGTRLGVKPLIDFDLGKKEFGDHIVQAFKDKQGVRWMIEQSDQLASDLDDEKGSTYTRAAAAMAKDIKRYLSMTPKFDALRI